MGWIILAVVVAIILIIVAMFWGTYNSLVKLDERVNEAWSDITVQLKYRADLIPNVVETVKGYAAHEKSAFEDVTKARSAVMSANNVKAAAEAERSLEGLCQRSLQSPRLTQSSKPILTSSSCNYNCKM